MNYQEALNYISSVSWKGSRPGLERITELLDLMGNPQDKLRFIHIAGTNGKGSTAAFLSNILRNAGLKTGLFISPYIVRFNERMQINNVNISDDELARLTEKVKPFADQMQDSPTEFELITAIGFLYFQEHACDIVVLEVGMGGEFDATNVISEARLCIITAIGLDHMEYLGDTVEKIARTKSGIIKPGSKTVLYKQDPGIMEVIAQRCEEVGSELYITEPESLELKQAELDCQIFGSSFGDLKIHLPASYQKNNLATALKAVRVLRESGYIIDDTAVKKGLDETRWPGRFEILHRDPVFLADGAHNPHGMKAATESLRTLFGDKKLIMIIGILADKDYDRMLDMVLPLSKVVLCVSPFNARALPAAELKRRVLQHPGTGEDECSDIYTDAFDSAQEAVDAAFRMAGKDDVICAIGSLYLIGHIKEIMEVRR